MATEDLGQMPTPTTQAPDLVAGGVDAPAEDPADEGLGRDLNPHQNPAVDDVLPDEVAEGDDKPQAPDGRADDQESGTEAQSGQQAEDGSPEPPA